MKKVLKAVLISIVIILVLLLLAFLLKGVNFEVLNPKGVIANKQKSLMIFAALLSLIVVVPVFAFTIFVALKYRVTNKKAKYSPDWDHNVAIETIWWAIPVLLILILSVVTWQSSHQLDPYKPIASDKKPIKIQVVSLQWKWLFIYPDLNIASMNYVQFPVDTPLNFEITSDAPMNSFIIPQLSGQIYAMSGMNTQLHIMASELGTYKGYSANISGKGFADMTFTATASSEADYFKWVSEVKNSGNNLTLLKYSDISEPTQGFPVTYYSPVKAGLYDSIIMKYMPDQNIDMGDKDNKDGR